VDACEDIRYVESGRDFRTVDLDLNEVQCGSVDPEGSPFARDGFTMKSDQMPAAPPCRNLVVEAPSRPIIESLFVPTGGAAVVVHQQVRRERRERSGSQRASAREAVRVAALEMWSVGERHHLIAIDHGHLQFEGVATLEALGSRALLETLDSLQADVVGQAL